MGNAVGERQRNKHQNWKRVQQPPSKHAHIGSKRTDGGQFDDKYSTEVSYSGSDQDMGGSGGDRRGVKREKNEQEVKKVTAV